MERVEHLSFLESQSTESKDSKMITIVWRDTFTSENWRTWKVPNLNYGLNYDMCHQSAVQIVNRGWRWSDKRVSLHHGIDLRKSKRVREVIHLSLLSCSSVCLYFVHPLKGFALCSIRVIPLWKKKYCEFAWLWCQFVLITFEFLANPTKKFRRYCRGWNM